MRKRKQLLKSKSHAFDFIGIRGQARLRLEFMEPKTKEEALRVFDDIAAVHVCRRLDVEF